MVERAREVWGTRFEPRGGSSFAMDSLDAFVTLVHRTQQTADDLVLLHHGPLPELRSEVATLVCELSGDHPRALERALAITMRRDPFTRPICERLRLEHRVYRESSEQLDWFMAILSHDDHGGHRQALGQYLRLLVESLISHLDDERRSLGERPRVSDTREGRELGKTGAVLVRLRHE